MAVTAKRKKKPSITCKGCKAELEFEFTDLEGFYPEYDYTSAGREGVGVRCPDCKTLTEYPSASGELIAEVWAKKRAATP